MKKITLKITTFLLLTMFAFQVQGQIDPAKIYTLRNNATGNYMTPSTVSNYFEPNFNYTTANQNFTFVATTFSSQAVFNVVSASTSGAMRGAGSGAGWKIFNTVTEAPTADNAHGDKVWLLEVVDISDPAAMLYRIANRTSTRWLYEVGAPSAADLTYIISDDNTDQRSVWLVEEATVLSADEFDTSSIFISNPVNNQLSIKGLTSNVKQVSVYSLLGQKVLTRKVEAQSSLTIDVSNLRSGMYLVEMKGDKGIFTKKIIKQ